MREKQDATGIKPQLLLKQGEVRGLCVDCDKEALDGELRCLKCKKRRIGRGAFKVALMFALLPRHWPPR